MRKHCSKTCHVCSDKETTTAKTTTTTTTTTNKGDGEWITRQGSWKFFQKLYDTKWFSLS